MTSRSKESPPPAAAPGTNWEVRWMCLGVILLALVLYGNLASKELIYDSSYVVGNDPRVKQVSGENLLFIFTRDYWWPALASNLYRPITTLSFMFDHSVLGFGVNPIGYQRVNLLLHCLNLCLLISLLHRLRLPPLACLAAGAWVSIHPYGTEVITNIVGRSDLLAAFFSLLTLWLWERRREVNGGAGYAWLMAFSLLLGALSKEIGLMGFPMLAIWVWLRGDGEGLLARFEPLRNLPVALSFAACAAIVVWSRLHFQIDPMNHEITFIDNPLQGSDFVRARLSAAQVAWIGFKDLLLPFGLSADYSFAQIIPLRKGAPLVDHLWGALAMLGVVSVALGALYLTWKRQIAAAFVLMGGLALAPTSNLLILIGSIRADRFWYFPLIFLLPALTMLVWQALSSHAEKLRPGLRAFLPIGAACYAIALCALTLSRNAEWTSAERFWRGLVLDSPNSMRAKSSAAGTLAETAKSEAEFQRAEQLLGEVKALEELHNLTPHQRPSRLIDTYARLYALWAEWADEENQPERARELRNRALDYFRKGITEFESGAEEPYRTKRETENLNRRQLSPLTDYCRIMMIEKRHAEVVAKLEETLKQDPTHPLWLAIIGESYAAVGRHREAVRALILAIFLAESETRDVTAVSDSIRALHPDAQPVAEAVDGRVTRLNLSDRYVHAYIRHYGSVALTLSARHDGKRVAGNMRRFMRFEMGLDIQPLEGDLGALYEPSFPAENSSTEAPKP